MIRLLAVLVLAGASAQAEITYYFGGTLSNNWGTLSAGTPFYGSFSYDFPQTSHSYFDGGRAAYYVNSLAVTFGNESAVMDQGYRNLVVAIIPNELAFVNVTANDPSWVQNRPILGGIPVGITVEVADYYNSNGGGASLPYLSSNNLVGGELRLEMFNSSRFVISDTNGGSQISSPLTSFVPEPSALSLLAVGLGGLVMMRRRRS